MMSDCYKFFHSSVLSHNMDGYSQRFPLIIGANNGQVHNASLGQTSEPDAPHSLEKKGLLGPVLSWKIYLKICVG